MKNRKIPLSLFLAGGAGTFLFLSCSNPFKDLGVSYTPPAVFTGYVSGNYDSLPGNRDWKNLCYLAGDTVRMRFYSENFSSTNGMNSGDFIRMDLFPCSTCIDAGDMDARHIILHVALYRNGNYSYEVTPVDSLSAGNAVRLHVKSLSRSSGASLELEKIEATAKAMTGSISLQIKNGKIFGTIQ